MTAFSTSSPQGTPGGEPGASVSSRASYVADDLLVVMVVDDRETEPPRGVEASEDGMGHRGDGAGELVSRGLKIDEPLAHNHQLVVNDLARDPLRHDSFWCLSPSAGDETDP